MAVGPLAAGLDDFLAAHPTAPDQATRVDEVARTASASYHVVQARGSERPHRHVQHDLTVVVLRGRGTLTLGTSRLPLVAGDTALIPRATVHWFAVEDASAAVALAIFSPPLVAPDSEPAD